MTAGDYRDRQGLELKAGLVGRGGEGLGRQGIKLQKNLDVRPGNEGAAGPGEEQHPNLGVPAHPVQCVLELREHLVIQGVEPVRAVEGDGGDSGLVVKQNGLV